MLSKFILFLVVLMMYDDELANFFTFSVSDHGNQFVFKSFS